MMRDDEQWQLDDATEQDLLRRCWYWHDARWFAAVAAEFGMEAANRINRANVLALGQVEMRRLMKAHGVERVGGIGEALRLYEEARRLYVPSSFMEVEVESVSEGGYDVAMRRCYVHENIVRAGIASTYECAVFDRLQGWHDAWGLPLAQPMPARTCALAAGRECRQRFTVARGELPVISTALAPPRRRFLRVVLPTWRRRWRIDADDVALPRREPRAPMVAVVGIVQATDVLAFDFGAPVHLSRR